MMLIGLLETDQQKAALLIAGYNNIASEFGVESNNMISKESLIEMFKCNCYSSVN